MRAVHGMLKLTIMRRLTTARGDCADTERIAVLQCCNFDSMASFLRDAKIVAELRHCPLYELFISQVMSHSSTAWTSLPVQRYGSSTHHPFLEVGLHTIMTQLQSVALFIVSAELIYYLEENTPNLAQVGRHRCKLTLSRRNICIRVRISVYRSLLRLAIELQLLLHKFLLLLLGQLQ